MTLRVAALHYGIVWRSNRVQWAQEVFPSTVTIPGWELDVTERRIAARPEGRNFIDQGEASDALEPALASWAAELTVVHDLPMEYWFIEAELVPDVPLAFSGRGELSIGDRLWANDQLQVVRTQSELPSPTWPRPPSDAARDLREYCLLPLRSHRRGEADVAYWLAEYLRHCPGSFADAAQRLNVSVGILRELKRLSGSALDRKAARSSQPLTPDQRGWLQRAVELLVLRLHLYDVGEPVGERRTRNQV